MADSIAADQVPKFAPFLGMAGVAFAMIFGSTSHNTKLKIFSRY